MTIASESASANISDERERNKFSRAQFGNLVADTLVHSRQAEYNKKVPSVSCFIGDLILHCQKVLLLFVDN